MQAWSATYRRSGVASRSLHSYGAPLSCDSSFRAIHTAASHAACFSLSFSSLSPSPPLHALLFCGYPGVPYEQVDGSEGSTQVLRNTLWTVSGHRGKYPQVRADGAKGKRGQEGGWGVCPWCFMVVHGGQDQIGNQGEGRFLCSTWYYITCSTKCDCSANKRHGQDSRNCRETK